MSIWNDVSDHFKNNRETYLAIGSALVVGVLAAMSGSSRASQITADSNTQPDHSSSGDDYWRTPDGAMFPSAEEAHDYMRDVYGTR